ncbi:MAG: hypothetical protein OEW00_06470 [candidate division Zixibacteria bacterium]|nr:hypothetical protein [candidate division Zixibacteria bacterium]
MKYIGFEALVKGKNTLKWVGFAKAPARLDGGQTVTNDEREIPLAAFAGLLDLFRQGHIIEPHVERQGIKQHTGSLTALWDRKFPGFPSEYFPYTSFRGQHYRGRRDAYLKSIIVQMLADHDSVDTVIVNPACVFGRHACDLASRLPRVRVLGTDIDPGWDRIYRLVRGFRIPDNYSFVKDDVFAPLLAVQPTAVVFFGACGAVTDGALDYAINSQARYLMCRTCCHDNIGGNISVIKRFNSVNRFFRFKNWAYGRMRSRAKYAGYYFSDKYSHNTYPRSETASRTSTSDEFQAVARHSADSDICRAIIDLDRHLYLVEKEFSVVYQGEMFVAERKV